MVASGAIFAWLLSDFSAMRLIQVVQGAAVVTAILNLVALWKQEARNPSRGRQSQTEAQPTFRETWARFSASSRARRFLFALAVGTAAFNMQDIVLEPYGGEILKLSVAETTALTALMALGALVAFAAAARMLTRGSDPARLAAMGLFVGLFAFACVILAAPFGSPMLFRAGVVLIGFGGGLFSVGTLTAAMELEREAGTGLALGAWGAVQALSMGLAVAAGGVLRDIVSHLAERGLLGPALTDPVTGYSAVYHIELLLLFVALAAIGPIVGRSRRANPVQPTFGLAEFPG
jgi:BCD family chlorophyll transporter-like MFS transporter